MTISSCPSNDELSQWMLGKLAGERAALVVAHVESCELCQTRLDALEESRARFSLDFSSAGISAELSEPSCAAAVEEVRQIGRALYRNSHPIDSGPPVPASLGPYQILEKLGQGGMGTVHKALHRRLKRIVAIKTLAPQRLRDPLAVARFHREMEAIGTLDHPNIVRASDADDEAGVHYLVMEYVDGIDLAKLVDRRGPLRSSDACALVQQAAVGLAHAHARGMVHRDIKPSNLMLTVTDSAESHSSSAGTTSQPRAVVKLLDLGLALLAEVDDQEEVTQADQLLGTLDYMAPEQLADTHQVDIRADLYALGATLFKLLTGKSPLPTLGGEPRWRKLALAANGERLAVSELRPDLPPALAALLDRLLQRDRDRRLASPSELVAALEPFAQDADLVGLYARATSGELRQEQVRVAAASIPASSATSPATSGGQRLGFMLLGAAIAAVLTLPWTRPWAVEREPVEQEREVANANVADGLATSPLDEPSAESVSDDEPTRTWYGWPADAPPAAQVPFTLAQANDLQEAWSKYLDVPREWSNSIGVKFKLLPPGEYLRGSTHDEINATLATIAPNTRNWHDHVRSEAPRHVVVLTQPFFLGTREVTQAEFVAVIGGNPAHFQQPTDDENPADRPVENVSWHRVLEFCHALNKLEGCGDWTEDIPEPRGAYYRLPTEAEWEFACRAGAETRFSAGDTVQDLATVAWFNANSRRHPHPVATRAPNAFGLYDMHGNVWEWCLDGWDPRAYHQFERSPAIDPLTFSVVHTERVHRGGDWNYVAEVCRSSHRHGTAPQDRSQFLGFRLAISLEGFRRRANTAPASSGSAP